MKNDLIAITKVATVSEAHIICTVLREAGIDAFVPNENMSAMFPHMFTAINPSGVNVLINAEDAESAKEALQLARSDTCEFVRRADKTESLSDALARKAALCALFTWLFPPIVLWAIYYAVKAIRVSDEHPPAKPREFNQNLWATLVLGISLGLATMFVWLQVIDWM